MRLAEDLFLLSRGAFPPFFDIIAQNIPYHSQYYKRLKGVVIIVGVVGVVGVYHE